MKSSEDCDLEEDRSALPEFRDVGSYDMPWGQVTSFDGSEHG